MANRGPSDHPIVVATGVLASAIGILVFVSGRSSLPEFWREATKPTQLHSTPQGGADPTARRSYRPAAADIDAEHAVQSNSESAFSSTDRYFVRAFNCDDGGRAFVNGTMVAEVGFGDDSGWIEVTRHLVAGENFFKLQVINDGGAITYGFQVSRNDALIFNSTCGTHHQFGCENNRQNFPVGVAREIPFSVAVK